MLRKHRNPSKKKNWGEKSDLSKIMQAIPSCSVLGKYPTLNLVTSLGLTLLTDGNIEKKLTDLRSFLNFINRKYNAIYL